MAFSAFSSHLSTMHGLNAVSVYASLCVRGQKTLYSNGGLLNTETPESYKNVFWCFGHNVWSICLTNICLHLFCTCCSLAGWCICVYVCVLIRSKTYANLHFSYLHLSLSTYIKKRDENVFLQQLGTSSGKLFVTNTHESLFMATWQPNLWGIITYFSMVKMKQLHSDTKYLQTVKMY